MPYVYDKRSGDQSGQKMLSWRTGVGSRSRTDDWSSPPKWEGQDLGTYLSQRNRWYAQQTENLQFGDRYRGFALTGDSGHRFQSLKGSAGGGRFEVTYTTDAAPQAGPNGCEIWYPSRDAYLWDIAHPSTGYLSGLADWPVVQPSYSTQSSDLASDTLGAFNSMIPDKSFAGWGETVIELLRGNIPRLVSDLGVRIKRGRELDPRATARDLGNDYLNARFGIEPILRDVVSTVEHLMGVSGLIYRQVSRKRATVTRSYRVGTPTRGVFRRADNARQYYIIPVSSRGDVRLTSDARLSAKFVKASSTRGSNGFLDQAQVFLHSIGVNPKLSWDLVPYSFLLDWSGTIGKSIENATAFNPATGEWLSQYAWVTRRDVSSASHTAFAYTERFGSGYATYRVSGAFSRAVFQKRYPGSPFGLSFTLPQLSAYQWSILAALGLARVP